MTISNPQPHKHAYLFTIQYDGSALSGWQIQSQGERTAQGEFERALVNFLGGPAHLYRVQGASRTDAGVHALGQAVRAVLPQPLPYTALVKGLNHFLPSDVRVVDVCACALDFSPIRGAIQKEYNYFFYWGGCGEVPLLRHQMVYCRSAYDETRMAEAASLFEGQHDFANFYCKGSEVATTVRRLMKCEIVRLKGDDYHHLLLPPSRYHIYFLRVVGEGFLKQMVRLIVGAIWSYALGRVSREELERALAGQAEVGKKFGAVAPAHGLYLKRIDWGPEALALLSTIEK